MSCDQVDDQCDIDAKVIGDRYGLSVKHEILIIVTVIVASGD